MSATRLRAEGVSVRLGGSTVLDGVDLDVRGGELVALPEAVPLVEPRAHGAAG